MKNLEIRMKLVRDANSVQEQINDAKRIEAAHRDAANGIQQGRDALGRFVTGSAKATTDAEIIEIKRRLTADQAAQMARNQFTDQANRAAVDSAMRAIDKQVFAQSSLTGKIKIGSSALLEMAGGWAAVGSAAMQAIQAVSEMWAAQNKEVENAVRNVTSYREQLAELGMLNGNLGQTTAEISKTLDLRNSTLQTRDQAIKFAEGAANAGQASIGAGFITRQEFDKSQKYIGAYQAAINADPNALGNLAGLFPQIVGTQNQSAEDVARRVFGLFETMQMGRSDIGSAVRQFSQNAGLIGNGAYNSPEQLNAIQQALSMFSPDEAGTLTKQLLRGTVGGLTRMRGSQFEGSIPQSEYLAGLGATDQDNVESISKLIAADMARQQQADSADGKMFNAHTYLAMKGYTDEQARQAVIGFTGQINSGNYAKTFEKRSTPASAPAFADAMRPLDNFQVSPEALHRRALLAEDAADVKLASGPREIADSLNRIAFANLRGDGKTYGTYEEWSKSNSPWKGSIVDQAKAMLDEQGLAAGVKPPGSSVGDSAYNVLPQVFDTLFPASIARLLGAGGSTGVTGGSLGSRLFYSEQTRAQATYEQANAIAGAGGKPGSIDKLIQINEKQLESQQKQYELMLRERNRVGAPVRQVGPPRPPVR